jgi:aspartate kinase
MLKVCKFGGTSVAGSAEIENVAKIVLSDKERKYIIVSAPGKRYKGDTKITDLLYKCADEASKTGDCPSFEIVANRFREIVKELKVKIDIDSYLSAVKENIISTKGDKNYAASRGEYLNALIISAKLGFEFIDAADIVKFNHKGQFDGVYTSDIASARLKKAENAVIPGFYGSLSDGKIKTFSRGGSDITGSIIAEAVNADLYENWTDVDGFLTADPNIVENPALIDMLSYKELRELSYMGATVLHSEAVFPVWEKNIPIEIKNTFRPDKKGTIIVANTDYDKTGKVATGIAGKKDFTVIFIEKQLMNSELGYCRRVLSVLEYNGISIEHIPTGIDTMSLIIESSQIKGKLDAVLKGISAAVTYDNLTVFEGLSLIALVGHGMRYRIGTAARLFSALGKSNINIKMIDQGSSELNIIIGVDNSDYENSIKVIYKEFFQK